MEEEYNEYYFEAGDELEITVDSQQRDGLYDVLLTTSHLDDDGTNTIGALTLALTLEQMIQLSDILHECVNMLKDNE